MSAFGSCVIHKTTLIFIFQLSMPHHIYSHCNQNRWKLIDWVCQVSMCAHQRDSDQPAHPYLKHNAQNL